MVAGDNHFCRSFVFGPIKIRLVFDECFGNFDGGIFIGYFIRLRFFLSPPRRALPYPPRAEKEGKRGSRLI